MKTNLHRQLKIFTNYIRYQQQVFTYNFIRKLLNSTLSASAIHVNIKCVNVWHNKIIRNGNHCMCSTGTHYLYTVSGCESHRLVTSLIRRKLKWNGGNWSNILVLSRRKQTMGKALGYTVCCTVGAFNRWIRGSGEE